MKNLFLSLLLVSLGAAVSVAQDGGTAAPEKQDAPKIAWRTDWNAAKTEAAAAGKDLFIDFTGSDWCGWCKRLDAEVFAKDEFARANADRFVFVYLDFPQAQELKDKVVDAALNEKLSKEYGVGGFPTIVLATAEGAPYAKTGYQEGGAPAYNKHVDELRGSAKAVRQALAAEEPTLADLKVAVPALAKAGLLGWPGYDKLVVAAKKHDPEGKEGLKAVIVAFEENAAFEKKLESYGDEEPNWVDLADFIDRHQTLNGQLFIQVAFATAVNLREGGHAERAKKLFERIGRQPEISGNERGQAAIAAEIEKCEKAMKKDAPVGGDDAGDEDAEDGAVR